MKKIIIIALSALAAITVSCDKQIAPEKETLSIKKSFKVVIPETKAYLGTNGETGKKLVKFEDGDMITIFANTSGNVYTGTYDATAEEFTTEITEEADADETVFYAAYPATYTGSDNVQYSNASAWKFRKTSGVYLEAQKVLSNQINAVKDGIDPEATVLTAKTDEDGQLSFSYGCAFFKIQAGFDDIKSIKLTTTKEKLGGRPQYDENNALKAVQSSVQEVVLNAESSLEKDGIYFIPFIPRFIDNSGNAQNVGDFTVTFTLTNGASKGVSTSALASESFVPGIIYNLGCPIVLFTPELSAESVSIEASSTEGAISYSLVNEVEGGQISAAIDGDFTPAEGNGAISNLVIDTENISATAIPFTCDANTGSIPLQAKVVITYTYNDTETISQDVIITQRVSGTAESHTHILYFSNGATVQTTDGSTGTYFSTAGSVITKWSNDYAVQSAVIDDVTYNQAIKLDSSGSVSFTTSTSLNSTVRFYCVRRKSGDSATVKLLAGGNEAASISPEHTSITNSGEIQLEKGTFYQIHFSNK